MKEFEISQGYKVLIDDCDYPLISRWSWSVQKRAGQLYARRNTGNGWVYMHRFILGTTNPKIKVDHKNSNGLDNQRSNLREGSQSQNLCNRGKTKLNKSGFKGVYLDKKAPLSAWTAEIHYQKQKYWLGRFNTKEAAALAYNNAARELHGDFARLNVIPA